ncbi:LLM class flavin-dependent oxidoreductase [Tenacibaculum ovolyticum]|uniref:LLM class flavin-dependent oxidoreductase n=1 Tax=Tenacibaculum ovolyticum TaxID=104270 RepID=UPI003BABEB26
MKHKTRYSILDLLPILEGADSANAINNAVALAQFADQANFTRFWVAEHHNMGGIASSATSVLIGHLAGKTQKIRVGAGGIMLPNHAPLMVAEHFGTLETIYPNRIDLGLGRAPGTDGHTARALRRKKALSTEDPFPTDVSELIGYFEDSSGQTVRAIPGEGTKVPVWILGASLYGAKLAAKLGLPYAFASYFAPDFLAQAVKVYRESFVPSKHLSEPYFMMSMSVFGADTDEQALYLRTSYQQVYGNLITGRPGPLPRPVDNIHNVMQPEVLRNVNHSMQINATGGPKKMREELKSIIETYQPDELIFYSPIHSLEQRIKSFEMAGEIVKDLSNNQ